MRRLPLFAAAVLACAGAAAPAASARSTDTPWPPAKGDGQLFAHIGEEHINDADGETILPAVVGAVARYRPALMTASGDKANDGKADQFELWQKALSKLDDAGVPYLAGIGNHDRTAPPGVPGGTIGLVGGTLPNSLDTYKRFFAGRPYPWGDAQPYAGIGPAERPANDPSGAAGTYSADVGDVRWIFLDNSCWSLSGCDAFQARADAGGSTQLEFLRAKATEATRAGKLVFVVMHIPTRDPRDQSYTDVTAQNHIMGKGTTADNRKFEEIAAVAGVDGVFVGHIKGQFLYRGRGDVPYFIDGGAGGELYTTGPVGTDHGYWHGLRLLRVAGGRIATTDTVPVLVPDGIRLSGPDVVQPGQTQLFEGFGRQPVFHDTAKVDGLELRDPNPTPKAARQAQLLGIALKDLAYGGPVLLVLLALGLSAVPGTRRRVAVGGGIAVVVAGGAGLSVAQQSIPTSTPKDALPNPARIWTSSDPAVLAPVASDSDDPRRDAATQTQDGRFRGACPGTATLTLTSGFEASDKAVRVASAPGAIVRGRPTARRTMRAGRRAEVARVRLAQPAVVTMRVLRGKTVVAQRARTCAPAGTRALRWSAKGAKPGRYTVEVRVASDRAPVVRRSTLRVARRSPAA
ncbi:metallophosphoesterase [Conexibacter sp. SYSU D00693]|uniref:metallophosphoesterase n=1 Tax=Conexibacter sp. SYSU D00693 TaxID=2812560 RepID=UPI00196B2665|nr:metallophosphoesterase [Conexibacter sp. SYSU D00693]